MHPDNDEDNEENDSEDTEKYKLVFADSIHHRSDQFPAFGKIVSHAWQFLSVGYHPSSVVAELAFDVVADIEGLVHHSHSIFQFVSGVWEQLAVSNKFWFVALLFLNKALFTSSSAPMSISLFF